MPLAVLSRIIASSHSLKVDNFCFLAAAIFEIFRPWKYLFSPALSHPKPVDPIIDSQFNWLYSLSKVGRSNKCQLFISFHSSLPNSSQSLSMYSSLNFMSRSSTNKWKRSLLHLSEAGEFFPSSFKLIKITSRRFLTYSRLKNRFQPLFR